jgi:hypothetical protein
MFCFSHFLLLFLFCQTHGQQTTTVDVDQFYTDQTITSAYGVSEACSKFVQARRLKAQEDGPTQGVIPTVGLGATLLIFILVGLLSVGIATAFHMVI